MTIPSSRLRTAASIRFLLFLTVLASCREESKNTTAPETDMATANEWISMQDGNSLEQWEGDPKIWRTENGTIIGEITPDNPISSNSFLIWKGDKPADFEFIGEFRITGEGNSGVNYRSERVDSIPYALRGYQADIDGKNRYTGQNYEERKRTTLAYRGEIAEIFSQDNANEPGSLRENVKNNAWQSRKITESLGSIDLLGAKIKTNDWNRIRILAEGHRLRHYINDILMSEVIDNDTINRADNGLIGVQVHVGPPMKVEYQNLQIRNITD